MKRETASGRLLPATTTRRRFLGTLAASAVPLALGGLPHTGRAAIIRSSAAESTLPTGLVFDDVCRRHLTGNDARECPQRYDAVLNALRKSEDFSALKIVSPRPVTDAEILACHDAGYLDLVGREVAAGARRLSTGDTRLCGDSLLAARHAAGAACVAVDAVMTGSVQNAFSVGRPPGHHATPKRGMGFCIFNNAGIAARFAQREFGIAKVLIVDWDLHHGNGTQDVFYDDPSVYYFSTHQSPLYPGTGRREETGHGKGLGSTMNRPLRAGAGRNEFRAAFDDLAKAMGRFQPELIIISAGFDARLGDPLGRLRLNDEDYVELTGRVLQIAHDYADGRLVSILEGGYSLTGLSCAAAAHVGRLQQG